MELELDEAPPVEKINGAKKESREEKRHRQLMEQFDKINEIRGQEFDFITANVYRESINGANVSLPKFENEILDDQGIGAKYGPGKYLVVYRWKNDDSEKWGRKEIRYNIGAEFEEVHREYCKNNRIRCFLDSNTLIPGTPAQAPAFNVMEFLQREKIESLAALAALIQKLFSRPESGESKNMIELFKTLIPAMMSGNSKPAQNDQLLNLLVTKAIEAPKENPLDQVRQMLALTGELKEIAQVESAPVQIEKESKVDKLIEMAVNMLPALVEKFGGSIEAAAAAQKSNPIVTSYLSTAEKRKQAFEALKAKYGHDYAIRWATGAGFDVSQFAPTPTTQSAAPIPTKSAFAPRVIEL